jgi:riboflavin biosynthesis pyrimidine reductase
MTHPLDVAAHAAELYGEELGAPGGVVHVVAATRASDGLLHVLAIGPHAPRSDTDFFVLQLCRARADVVLTSARILRDEPELSLSFMGPWAQALADYRQRVLGKAELGCAILTRSGDIPRSHPLLAESRAKLVLTSPDRKVELERQLAGVPNLRVLAGQHGDARSALALLKARGLAAISVEAGPSTAGTLYRPPACVDQLFLSLAPPDGLDPRAVGKALPPDDELLRGLTLMSDTARDERSGRWRFLRYVRES